MKTTLSFYFRCFIYWLGFFVCGKLIFLLFNFSQAKSLNFETLFGIFKYGLKLDLAMAGYITLFMTMVYLILIFLAFKYKMKVITYLNTVLVCIFTLIVVADARLYHYWGFKLDLTALRFLSQPKDAAASVQWLDIVLGVIGIAGLIVIAVKSHKKIFSHHNFAPLLWKPLVLTIFLLAFTILPIRGGTGVATVGLSSAYFNSNNFANHAAINTSWNLMYAYFNSKSHKIEFKEIDPVEVESTFSILYPPNNVLNAPFEIKDPLNVVLIVLESFSKGLVECIGGEPNVTPNLNKAAKTGWLFSNFYASGDRSDKGLTSLFTGAPALPEATVLRFPDKLAAFPHMYEHFHNKGYETTFMYGGNLDFANMRALFTMVDGCNIIGRSEIPTNSKTKTGKWGIHDELTFQYLNDIISRQKQPFFTTLYTLSSHEPFDVPKTSKTFSGPNAASYRAAWYTDSCLGIFLDQFSKSSLWKNTLVVITADHGIRHPGNLDVFHPDKFQIPLIFTGGIIKTQKKISEFKSHTDIPYTLQWWLLGEKDGNMNFSTSLFDTSTSFANFFYQVGTGMIDSTGCAVYDYFGKKLLYKNGANENNIKVLEHRTKCYMKHASDDFLEKR